MSAPTTAAPVASDDGDTPVVVWVIVAMSAWLFIVLVGYIIYKLARAKGHNPSCPEGVCSGCCTSAEEDCRNCLGCLEGEKVAKLAPTPFAATG
jgi:hypothetical protein